MADSMAAIADWQQASAPGSATMSEAVDISSVDYIPSFIPTGIIIVGAGNIIGQLQEHTTDQTIPVPTGFFPLSFKKITKVNTTATGMSVVRGKF